MKGAQLPTERSLFTHQATPHTNFDMRQCFYIPERSPNISRHIPLLSHTTEIPAKSPFVADMVPATARPQLDTSRFALHVVNSLLQLLPAGYEEVVALADEVKRLEEASGY